VGKDDFMKNGIIFFFVSEEWDIPYAIIKERQKNRRCVP
jgi:hypothetical protein